MNELTDNQAMAILAGGWLIGGIILAYFNVKKPMDDWPGPLLFLAMFALLLWPIMIPMGIIIFAIMLFFTGVKKVFILLGVKPIKEESEK